MHAPDREEETPLRHGPPSSAATQRTRQRTELELSRTKEELERRGHELLQSVALFRATLESTTDGVLVVSGEHSVTHYNQNLVRMWSIPAGRAFRGDASLLDAMCEQLRDPELGRARFAAVMASCAAESFDLLELRDGRLFECYSKLQLVGGSHASRVFSFRDITEIRRSQERLRDDARVLELLNATGKALASELDLDALLDAVTQAGTELSGAKFGAFFYNHTDENRESYMLFTLSGAPREAFEPLGHPRATPLFAPTFRGEPPIRLDDVLTDPRYAQMGPGMPPGHLPVRSYLAVPVIARSGEVIGGLFFGHPEPGVFTERSERIIVGIAAQAAIAIDNARLYEASQRANAERQRLLESERAAREAAETLSELKDEFLANLSHELRTPLNAILGWAQMLRSGERTVAERSKGLETIERNARIQAQLVEDLLDMSRILSGKLQLDVRPLEPRLCVEAAIDTLRPAAMAKGVELEVALDGTKELVSGDPSRLQQVMWNLLSNAIKFTPKGGRVQVTLAPGDGQLDLRVADTGIGITPEFLPLVFDRFRQADGSSTRRHGGLGLGLSIVKHLVELHGGTVRAESAGPGLGATFTVSLPVMTTAPRQSSRPPEPVRAASTIGQTFKIVDLSGVDVLVLDDEVDGRELVEQLLVSCSADVRTAGSAEAALALFAERKPDVVVSDIGMPNVDGYEFLRRLRALEGPGVTGRVPAIALTAFARSEDRTRALRAGFLVHIAKPVEAAELVATVASVVGRTCEL